MPYKRIGKTVYKKLPNGKLESVGVSDSVEKAKAHLRALYAAETNESLTEGLSPDVSKKAVAIFKSMIADKRDSLFKRYGVDAEKVAYGHAIAKAKQINEKQNMQQTDKLREMVRAALSTPMDEINSTTYINERESVITGNTQFKLGDTIHVNPNSYPSFEFPYGTTGKVVNIDRADYMSDDVIYTVKIKHIDQFGDLSNELHVEKPTQYINERESVTEDDWKQPDDESDMAKSQLHNLIKDAQRLESMIVDGEQLDAWVQAKLTKAQDYINSVHNYLCGEQSTKKHVDIELTERIFNRIKNRM